MTSPHLSERALQEEAESTARLLPTQAAHLRGCRLCQNRTATYQQLFTAAAHLPQPAFAFDLTASVLAQLPSVKPAFPWLLSAVGALVLGVVAVFLLLFGGGLRQTFQGASTLVGFGVIVVVGGVVAGHCLELLARHRQQMHLLTFS